MHTILFCRAAAIHSSEIIKCSLNSARWLPIIRLTNLRLWLRLGVTTVCLSRLQQKIYFFFIRCIFFFHCLVSFEGTVPLTFATQAYGICRLRPLPFCRSQCFLKKNSGMSSRLWLCIAFITSRHHPWCNLTSTTSSSIVGLECIEPHPSRLHTYTTFLVASFRSNNWTWLNLNIHILRVENPIL